MPLALCINVYGITFAVPDLIGIARMKLLILQVATKRYLKSPNPLGINLYLLTNIQLGNSPLVI